VIGRQLGSHPLVAGPVDWQALRETPRRWPEIEKAASWGAVLGHVIAQWRPTRLRVVRARRSTTRRCKKGLCTIEKKLARAVDEGQHEPRRRDAIRGRREGTTD